MRFPVLIFLMCAIALESCTGRLKNVGPLLETESATIDLGKADVDIHYFGTGGLMIENEEGKFMVDPFFSNARFLPVFFKSVITGYVKNKPVNMDTAFTKYGKEVSDTDGIFISHAHYDHLMDVPMIYQRHLSDGDTEIYGSHTTEFLMQASDLPSTNLTDVEPYMADQSTSGQWLPIAKGWKVLPIKTNHAPHVGKIKLYKGEHKRKLKRRKNDSTKSKLKHWKEGQTLAYLFSYQGAQDSINLYVQTSASDKPLGMIPQEVLSAYPIDVALLCVANYKNVIDYPHYLITELKPSQIVFVHWEDFFRPYLKKTRTVRGTCVRGFIKHIKTYYPSDQMIFPTPGTDIHLR